MKWAKYTVVSVEFFCPYCGEIVPNPNYNYSHTWDVNEVPNRCECSNCNKVFKFPRGYKGK